MSTAERLARAALVALALLIASPRAEAQITPVTTCDATWDFSGDGIDAMTIPASTAGRPILLAINLTPNRGIVAVTSNTAATWSLLPAETDRNSTGSVEFTMGWRLAVPAGSVTTVTIEVNSTGASTHGVVCAYEMTDTPSSPATDTAYTEITTVNTTFGTGPVTVDTPNALVVCMSGSDDADFVPNVGEGWTIDSETVEHLMLSRVVSSATNYSCSTTTAVPEVGATFMASVEGNGGGGGGPRPSALTILGVSEPD